jgi:NitT/TauT family transport system permease protein
MKASGAEEPGAGAVAEPRELGEGSDRRKFPSLQPNQFSTAGIGWDRPADPSDPENTRRTGASRSRSTRRRRRPPSRCRPIAKRVAAGAAISRRRAMTRRLVGAGAVGVIVLLWWLATPGRVGGPLDLAGHPAEPGGSDPQLPSLLNERALLQSIAATLKRVLIGFGLAALVGVPLGILAGSWRVIEAAGAPLALFGRNLPVAALIPLTILWFGIDETQKVMFIFIACVPFVYSDAVARSPACPIATSRRRRRSARRRWQIVTKVLVPLALPDIYNSLRHLFGLAFGYIMLAELINAEHGLGYLLMTSQRRGLSEHIILILIIIGLLAYGIDRAAVLVPARPVSLSACRGLAVAEPAAAAGRRASAPNVVEFRTSRSGSATSRHPRRDVLACRTCRTRASSSRSSGRRAAASRRCCG